MSITGSIRQKDAYRLTVGILCVALAVTGLPIDAVAMRPMAHKSTTGKKASSAGRRQGLSNLSEQAQRYVVLGEGKRDDIILGAKGLRNADLIQMLKVLYTARFVIEEELLPQHGTKAPISKRVVAQMLLGQLIETGALREEELQQGDKQQMLFRQRELLGELVTQLVENQTTKEGYTTIPSATFTTILTDLFGYPNIKITVSSDARGKRQLAEQIFYLLNYLGENRRALPEDTIHISIEDFSEQDTGKDVLYGLGFSPISHRKILSIRINPRQGNLDTQGFSQGLARSNLALKIVKIVSSEIEAMSYSDYGWNIETKTEGSVLITYEDVEEIDREGAGSLLEFLDSRQEGPAEVELPTDSLKSIFSLLGVLRQVEIEVLGEEENPLRKIRIFLDQGQALPVDQREGQLTVNIDKASSLKADNLLTAIRQSVAYLEQGPEDLEETAAAVGATGTGFGMIREAISLAREISSGRTTFREELEKGQPRLQRGSIRTTLFFSLLLAAGLVAIIVSNLFAPAPRDYEVIDEDGNIDNALSDLADGRIGFEELFPKVAVLLEDEDSIVRQAGRTAIERMGVSYPTETASYLIPLMLHDNERVSDAASDLLKSLDGKRVETQKVLDLIMPIIATIEESATITLSYFLEELNYEEIDPIGTLWLLMKADAGGSFYTLGLTQKILIGIGKVHAPEVIKFAEGLSKAEVYEQDRFALRILVNVDLETISTERTLEVLMPFFDKDGYGIRRDAGGVLERVISRLGPEEGLERLKRFVESPDPKDRIRLARVLRYFTFKEDHSRKSLSLVAILLEDEDPEISLETVRSFAKFDFELVDSRDAFELVKLLLDVNASRDMNYEGTKVLVRLDPKRIDNREAFDLLKALSEEDGKGDYVKGGIARALSVLDKTKIDNKEAFDLIRPFFKSGYSHVLQIAAQAMGSLDLTTGGIDNEEALELLKPLLKDGEPIVRAAAAKALGSLDFERVSSEGVFAQISSALRTEEDDRVIAALIASLGNLRHAEIEVKKMLELVRPFLTREIAPEEAEPWGNAVRKATIETIAKIGGTYPTEVNVLIEPLLHHTNSAIKADAALILAELGVTIIDISNIWDTLKLLLEDESRAVKAGGVAVLSRISETYKKEAIDLLEALSEETIPSLPRTGLVNVLDNTKEEQPQQTVGLAWQLLLPMYEGAKDAERLIEIICEIGQRYPQEVLLPVAQHMGSEDYYRREQAIAVAVRFAQTKPFAVIEEIMPLMSAENYSVKVGVSKVLTSINTGDMAPARARALVLSLLEDTTQLYADNGIAILSNYASARPAEAMDLMESLLERAEGEGLMKFKEIVAGALKAVISAEGDVDINRACRLLGPLLIGEEYRITAKAYFAWDKLAELYPTQAIGLLRSWWEDFEPGMQQRSSKVLNTLLELHPAVVLGFFEGALRSPRSPTEARVAMRQLSLLTLSQVDGNRVLAIISPYLESNDQELSSYAIMALGRIDFNAVNYEDALSALSPLLLREEVPTGAIAVLTKIGEAHPEEVTAFLGQIPDTESSAREDIITETLKVLDLTGIEPAKVFELLEPLLTSEKNEVAKSAAKTLGRASTFYPTEVMALIHDMSKDTDPKKREAAANAIGTLNRKKLDIPQDAYPLLFALLKDSDKKVVLAAAASLAVTPAKPEDTTEILRLLRPLLETLSSQNADLLSIALSRLKAPHRDVGAFLETLEPFLTGPIIRVRRSALALLEDLYESHPKKVFALLKRALSIEDGWYSKGIILETFILFDADDIDKGEAVKLATPAPEAPGAYNRTAIRVLDWIGTRKAYERIEEFLESSEDLDDSFRMAVVILQKAQEEAFFKEIDPRKALRMKGPEFRKVLRKALYLEREKCSDAQRERVNRFLWETFSSEKAKAHRMEIMDKLLLFVQSNELFAILEDSTASQIMSALPADMSTDQKVLIREAAGDRIVRLFHEGELSESESQRLLEVLRQKTRLSEFLGSLLIQRESRLPEGFKQALDEQLDNILPKYPPYESVFREGKDFARFKLYFLTADFYEQWLRQEFGNSEKWHKEIISKHGEETIVFTRRARDKFGNDIDIIIEVPPFGRTEDDFEHNVFSSLSDPETDVIVYFGHTGGGHQLLRSIQEAPKQREGTKIIYLESCSSFASYARYLYRFTKHVLGATATNWGTLGTVLIDSMVEGFLERDSWEGITERFTRKAQAKNRLIIAREGRDYDRPESYLFPHHKQTQGYKDSDGDGIPDSTDTVYNLSRAMQEDFVRYEDFQYRPESTVATVPMNDVLEYIYYRFNSTHWKLLRRFALISPRIAGEEQQTRIAGWYRPEEDSQELFIFGRTFNYNTRRDEYVLGINLGYQYSSTRALKMGVVYELCRHLSESFDLAQDEGGNIVEEYAYSELTPAEEAWSFIKAFEVLALEHNNTAEGRQNRPLFEDLYSKFLEQYRSTLPDGFGQVINFEIANKAYHAKALAGTERIAENERALDLLLEVFGTNRDDFIEGINEARPAKQSSAGELSPADPLAEDILSGASVQRGQRSQALEPVSIPEAGPVRRSVPTDSFDSAA